LLTGTPGGFLTQNYTSTDPTGLNSGLRLLPYDATKGHKKLNMFC
jgi:hypothetical protein